MVTIKSQSKRQGLAKQHKIVKRVTEHHKKARRIAKQLKLTQQAKHKKTGLLPIPNSCPFKRELVETVIAVKKAKEEARIQATAAKKAAAAGLAERMDMN